MAQIRFHEFGSKQKPLVPRRCLHLIRFHGVLAPNAGLRAAIVPGSRENASEPADEPAHGALARMGQGKSGSATGLTIPRGLRSRDAVGVPRREAIRVDAGFEWLSRGGGFSATTARLTTSWAGDIVADSQKRRLSFLFATIPANAAGMIPRCYSCHLQLQ